jgi:hypothetical protein
MGMSSGVAMDAQAQIQGAKSAWTIQDLSAETGLSDTDLLELAGRGIFTLLGRGREAEPSYTNARGHDRLVAHLHSPTINILDYVDDGFAILEPESIPLRWDNALEWCEAFSPSGVIVKDWVFRTLKGATVPRKHLHQTQAISLVTGGWKECLRLTASPEPARIILGGNESA